MSGFNNVVFSRNHYTPHYNTPYRIERVTIHLKDLGTTATIYPLFNVNQIPRNLIQFLTQEYNDEISRGDTLPFFEQLTLEEFQDYWFGQFAAVMCIGEEPELSHSITTHEWAKRCLGSFFIKSAYPGRCSHISTTNFLVNAGIRKRGIGFYMCECFLRWAPILGYSRCIIDLIFETNGGGKRLLEKCGFTKVGKVNSCAILKSTKDLLINAIIYTKELSIIEDDANTSKHANILTYLLSGQYPENASREDRSRLRALAYHYEVVDSKLYLKGKEVISEPEEQVRLTKIIHDQEHMGINRTTKAISSKYYWSKIKSTVKKVLEDCSVCKQALSSDSAKSRKKQQLKPPGSSTEANSSSMDIHNIPTLSSQVANPKSSTAQQESVLGRQQIPTPDDMLLKQSENALLDYMGIEPAHGFQPLLQGNSANAKARTFDANILNHSNNTLGGSGDGNSGGRGNENVNSETEKVGTPFTSMLNYYNVNPQHAYNPDGENAGISSYKRGLKRTNESGLIGQHSYGNDIYYNDENILFSNENYNEEEDDDYEDNNNEDDDDDDEEEDDDDEDEDGVDDEDHDRGEVAGEGGGGTSGNGNEYANES